MRDQRRNAKESIRIEWQRDLFFWKRKYSLSSGSIKVMFASIFAFDSMVLEFLSFYMMLLFPLFSRIINQDLNEILIKRAFTMFNVCNITFQIFSWKLEKMEKRAFRLGFFYSSRVKSTILWILWFKLWVSFSSLMNQTYLLVPWFVAEKKWRGNGRKGNATRADKRSRAWRFSRGDVTSDGS